jgi:hypothetical protein
VDGLSLPFNGGVMVFSSDRHTLLRINWQGCATTCSVTFSQLAAVDLILEIAIKTNTEYYVDSVCQVN